MPHKENNMFTKKSFLSFISLLFLLVLPSFIKTAEEVVKRPMRKFVHAMKGYYPLPNPTVFPEKYTSTLFQNINLLTKRGLSSTCINLYIKECLTALPFNELEFQARIIPTGSRTYVIGDIHCSFDVLLAQIEQMRKLDCFKNPHSLQLKDNNYLIFTGDLADRGTEGTKVWLLAMGLKILNPNNVFICRGNHETRYLMSYYGFIDELRSHFYRTKLESDFELLFSYLPVAVFLGIKNKAGIVS